MDRLPAILGRRSVDALDVGCGSGSFSAILAAAGLHGRYTGTDIQDRFRHTDGGDEPFERTFILGDAHDLPADRTFDLIFSVSALEHIPSDGTLVGKLDRLLAPGGVQCHIVPAGWALPLYLWHGYRQYSRRAIVERFGTQGTRVCKLGGPMSWLLHLLWITGPEIFLGISPRSRFAGLYHRLMRLGIRIDGWLRVMPTMYAVTRTKPVD